MVIVPDAMFVIEHVQKEVSTKFRNTQRRALVDSETTAALACIPDAEYA